LTKHPKTKNPQRGESGAGWIECLLFSRGRFSRTWFETRLPRVSGARKLMCCKSVQIGAGLDYTPNAGLFPRRSSAARTAVGPIPA
jgi:hypothetical protein